MTISTKVVLGAAMLAAAVRTACAGPCTTEIDRMQLRLNEKVEATASAGRSAPQGSTALLHRQPTPSSIASAESKVGELSASTIEKVKAAMARDAYHAGNRAACEQALDDLRHALPSTFE